MASRYEPFLNAALPSAFTSSADFGGGGGSGTSGTSGSSTSISASSDELIVWLPVRGGVSALGWVNCDPFATSAAALVDTLLRMAESLPVSIKCTTTINSIVYVHTIGGTNSNTNLAAEGWPATT